MAHQLPPPLLLIGTLRDLLTVKRLSGFIKFSGSEHIGSTFVLVRLGASPTNIIKPIHQMPIGMTIFIVDDDQDDVEFLLDAAKTLFPMIEIKVAGDGEEALEVLEQMHALPSVIFLDTNMPRMNGKDLLLHLKDDPALCTIPIVMHSTNFSDSDLILFSTYKAYTMQKQPNYDQLLKELKVLLQKIEPTYL